MTRVPDLGGLHLLREWQAAMRSVVSSAAGHSDIPRQLVAPLQRQAEVLQEVIEREHQLQRDVIGRLLAPADAIFDLLEESGAALQQQAEALEQAARALEQTAGLMKTQAALFERTVHTVREPTEMAKAVVGLETRQRKPGKSGKRADDASQG